MRADADGGELIRHGDGLRRGRAVHLPRTEGHVPPLPLPQRRHRRAAQAQLRASGREGRRHVRRHQRRNAPAPNARPEPLAAKGVSPDGNHGAGSVEAAKGPPRAIGQHFEGVAFRTFSAPVRLSFFLSLFIIGSREEEVTS